MWQNFSWLHRDHIRLSVETQYGDELRTFYISLGIDVNIFKPHSTRAASTTAAFSSKVPLATILRTAGWQKDCTFRKLYKKPIVVDKSFTENLLISYAWIVCVNIEYTRSLEKYNHIYIYWFEYNLEIEFINSKVSFKPEVPNWEKK